MPKIGPMRLGVLALLLLFFPYFSLQDSLAAVRSDLVVDAESGRVLYAYRPDRRVYPASLAKMMTAYLVFSALDSGQTSLHRSMRVSARAARQPAVKLSLRAGDKITVEQGILALLLYSANDVALVLAEHCGGTRERFVAQMNAQARRLGLKDTVFRNASGLPDKRQVTTARDMTLLARALWRDFPKYSGRYFARSHFTFRGRRYKNRNRLIRQLAGSDGLKTGYTRASGYNLAASAQRRGSRVIGLSFGHSTSKKRDYHLARLVNKAFAKLQREASLSPSPRLRPLAPVPPERVRKSRPLAPVPPERVRKSGQEVEAPRVTFRARALDSLGRTRVAPSNLAARSEDSAPTGDSEANAAWPAHWAVQLAAFRHGPLLRDYLARIKRRWPEAADQISVLQTRDSQGHLYRVRLVGLMREQALRACSVATGRLHEECLVLPPILARIGS